MRADLPHPDQQTCQCDHLSHHLRTFTTPDGKQGHRHLAMFSDEELFLVPGPAGNHIRVCVSCAVDCHCQEVINLIREGV